MQMLRRTSLLVAVSVALFVWATPVVAASTSRFTVTLTIRGHLARDIGFDLTPFPSVGGLPFCVPAANPLEIEAPICASGRTYTSGLTVGPGQSVDYEITLYHPTWARALWSGTITWDGRNHRLDYVVDFDLPTTDTAAIEPSAFPQSRLPPMALPILAVAWLVGCRTWVTVRRRQGTARR